VTRWIDNWGALVATLGLLLVTGWYAALTNRLAKSAEVSADSARDAAESARMTAAATVASVRVALSLSPRYSIGIDEMASGDREGPMAFGIDIRCLEGSVFIHRAVLRHAGEAALLPRVHVTMNLRDVELVLERRRLPRRVHAGEALEFELPEDRRTRAHVGQLVVVVWYSLDGSDDPIPLTVEWRGEPGHDYPVVKEWSPEAVQEFQRRREIAEAESPEYD
jgi:hypothetical protein